jgi:outer membrane protein assembly factor BamB
MTNSMLKRRAALTLSLAALASCSTPKSAIPGVQTPVLPPAAGLDVAVDAPTVTVPAPVALTDWPQVLAGPAHAPGNIAGSTGLTRAWTAKIGAPGGYRQPLTSSPLLAQNMVFTMDSDGAVAAFAVDTGNRVWRTITRPKHVSAQPLGGGIGFDSGVIYASTGYAEVLAIDAASGVIKWRQPLDFPARSAPTIAGGIVALVTQNDLLLTFDSVSGAPGWRFTGKVTDAATSVAAAGAPAFDSGILVAGFASGTLAALDAASGTPVWEQSMASPYGQASPLDFSDVVAPPVIAGGVVYAVSLGQTALAIDLHSGAKVWERSVSGTQAVYLAGGFAYLLDVDQQLAAIHADDGLVCWSLQLPNFRNMKTQKGPRSFSGPMMIDGQLAFTTSRGELATVDPAAGRLGQISKLADGPIDLPPIAAGGRMLVLSRDAVLTAYT